MMFRASSVKRRQNSPIVSTAVNYDGEGKLSSFKTVDPFYTFSVVKNTVDGKFYFAAMGRYETDRDPFVYKYNRTTNKIEDEYRIRIGVRVEDTHRSPTITHDDNGHVLLCAEQLQETVDSHATPIDIYKTSTVGDLSTLKRITTLSGRFAYPIIHCNGQNVMVSARGATGSTFIRGDYYYWASTDGGATFGSAVQLYDSGDEQKVAYFQRVHAYNGEHHLILNERDNDLANWTFVAHIKSADGITWTNQAGTFSKNVTSSGAITRAEMVSNCLVLQSPDTANIAVCFEGGVVKTTGGIRLCISVQSLTGNTYIGNPEVEFDDLRFYTYSAGWTYNSVTIPANLVTYWAYERPVQYLNSDEDFDDIILVDLTASHNVYKLRSDDNFATQTDTLLLAGNNKYMMGEGAYNVSDEDDYIVVLNNPQGDIFEVSDAEGQEDYSDLTVIRP